MNLQSQFEIFVSKTIAEQHPDLDEKFVRDFLFSLETDEKFCIPAEKLIEWRVFQYNRDIKKRLKISECKEGDDFCAVHRKNNKRGRPAENILLTVDCFKQLCMMARNDAGKKTRKCYLIFEKLFKKFSEEEFERQLKEKDKEIERRKEKNLELESNLLDEYLETNKLKESLLGIKKKFTHRYKFPIKDCVYILYDPDCKYDKFKIGYSKDINQRLKADRTMIPNIKIGAIFYTSHCEVFEQIIKIKFAEHLEQPSHEWVFESLDNLIEAYREVDRVGKFKAEEEKCVWKYNHEIPPKHMFQNEEVKQRVKQRVEQCRKPPKNIPTYQNKLEEQMAEILPTRLLRYAYRMKNKNAPESQRYCNGYCQTYQPISAFKYRSCSLMTVCKFCEGMMDIAISKIKRGVLTARQIRKDPSILRIGDHERICQKCFFILHKDDFHKGRRQCKKCRYAMRSQFGDKFDEVINQEVEILHSLSGDELKEKLDAYVRDELRKLLTYTKVGRKYNDNKQDMINKLHTYFST